MEGLALEGFGPINLVIIQPTSFCNLNCRYCYLPDRDRRHELALDLIEPIFKAIFESPFVDEGFTVCWHAGEPLAVPVAFYEEAFARIAAAQRAHDRRGVRIVQSVQTNAIPINQAWCDLFRAHDVQVGVSVDGPAFIHDAQRTTRSGAGSHAAAMRGVALLGANKIPFNVIAVVSETSLDHADEIYDFFVEHAMTDVGFNMEETEGINRTSSLDAGDHEPRYRAFMQRIWERTSADGGIFKLREFEGLANVIFYGQRMTHTDMNRPFAIVNFDYQGNFSTFDPELLGVQTERYGEFVLGNVRRDSLVSVCSGEKFARMHNEMRAGVERCRSECAYFSVCGGGCGSNKYWENGSFDSTETKSCRYRVKAVTDIVLDALEHRMPA